MTEREQLVEETEEYKDPFANNGSKVVRPGVVEVTTSVGVWTINKPKAGVRNRALALAENESGGFKKTTLFMELIPKCIVKRPENIDPDIKIEHILDGLEIEDYDELFAGLYPLIDPTDDEAEEERKN